MFIHDGVEAVKKAKIDGFLAVEFQLADLQFDQEYARQIELVVEIVDADTGKPFVLVFYYSLILLLF